jgi:hypothetical protein
VKALKEVGSVAITVPCPSLPPCRKTQTRARYPVLLVPWAIAAMELRPRINGLADMPAIDVKEAVLRNWRRDRSNLFIMDSLKLRGLLKTAR